MLICEKTGCTYTAKNGPITGAIYCPDCGTSLVPMIPAGPNVVGSASSIRGTRLAAGLIDVAISIVFVLIAMVPGINLIGSLIDTAFWLLRDINGASLGKHLLGLEVRTVGGAVPSKGALMMRNLPFAPLIFQFIPVFGNLILPFVGVIFFVELLLLIFSDRRVGDFLAGTKVMKKSTQTIRTFSAAAR